MNEITIYNKTYQLPQIEQQSFKSLKQTVEDAYEMVSSGKKPVKVMGLTFYEKRLARMNNLLASPICWPITNK